MTSVGSNQSSNRCVFNKTKSDQNETSIKLNLGKFTIYYTELSHLFYYWLIKVN